MTATEDRLVLALVRQGAGTEAVVRLTHGLGPAVDRVERPGVGRAGDWASAQNESALDGKERDEQGDAA